MTATRKGILGKTMRRMRPAGSAVVTRMTRAKSKLTEPASQLGENVALARPGRLVNSHWPAAPCGAMGVALLLARDQVRARALRQGLLEAHRHFGLLALALCCVRVALCDRRGRLQTSDHSSSPMRRVASLTQIVSYLLLLILLLPGWFLSGAEGKPVHLSGGTLPALAGADKDLADSMQIWHQDTAWLLLGLVLLQMAAALFQHFVLRRWSALVEVVETQSLVGVWPSSFTAAPHQDRGISCCLS